MPDPVTEVVLAEADLDALVSPTSSDVWREMHGHSPEAVAAIAAKLAKEGGGGGSLPAWWTVDSTPGSESVEFAGAVEIEPGYDAEALVIRTNLDPGGLQTTLPFQFYDEEGDLAVDIDSQGIFDVRTFNVQDPPNTGGGPGTSASQVVPGQWKISYAADNGSIPPLSIEKWDGVSAYLPRFRIGFSGAIMQPAPTDLNETSLEMFSPVTPTGNAIELWDNAYNNMLFGLAYTGAVEIAPSTDVEALVIRTNLDPGANQTTLPFQFFDEDGNLSADFDSQGSFDIRHLVVQNPPDTGADGGSVVIQPQGNVKITPRDASVNGLEVLNSAFQNLLLLRGGGSGSILDLSPRDDGDTAMLIVSHATPTVDAIQIWDNGFNNTIFAVTATGGLKPTLPTANPGAGILWNDGGTVKVGT